MAEFVTQRKEHTTVPAGGFERREKRNADVNEVTFGPILPEYIRVLELSQVCHNELNGDEFSRVRSEEAHAISRL